MHTKTNIHLVRGTIVHETLELFFKLKVYTRAGENYSDLRKAVLALFDTAWHNHENDLEKIDLKSQDLAFYYDDSRRMILNWLHVFLKNPEKDFFPRTEQKLFSKKYKVWGIIDIITNSNKTPQIIDYKTCKSMTMTDEYRLQLAIYSLLYNENMKGEKHLIGIHFLKFKDGLKMFKPSEKSYKFALDKIKIVRKGTTTKDIADYPCTCGGWCKKDFNFEN